MFLILQKMNEVIDFTEGELSDFRERLSVFFLEKVQNIDGKSLKIEDYNFRAEDWAVLNDVFSLKKIARERMKDLICALLIVGRTFPELEDTADNFCKESAQIFTDSFSAQS